jgi:hypothetical protein
MKEFSLSNALNEKVFFYCCPLNADNFKQSIYQHSIVCLAEGLKALGVSFYADRNFWQLTADKEEYLFNYDPDVTPDDCSIVVLNGAWFTEGYPLPDRLFHRQRKYTTVYFERGSDSRHGWGDSFRSFDFIFRPHYNSRFKYPSNFHPWAFGLSNRILEQLETIPDFDERQRSLLVNFRIGHSVRKQVQEQFFPLIQEVLPIDNSVDCLDVPPQAADDYLQWYQTVGRHYPSYYQRLKDATACACFGGVSINDWPPNAFGPVTVWDRAINKILSDLKLQSRRIMNWESWRFWESLAAGCVTFHVNFEKYGLYLPVMPENWQHYIGVDLADMSATIARIRDEPEQLEQISKQGREWAIAHYSPVPTAIRFLETIR